MMGRACVFRGRLLVQRLPLDQGGTVVAAGPERGKRFRIVDEDAADVRFPGQLIFDGLTGLRVEPHRTVRVHAAGPDVAVLVDGGAVRPSRSRHRVFRHLFRFRVEYRDLVAAIFGDHDAILVVDIHSPRAGVFGRKLVPPDLTGLGIDLADIAFLEFGHPQVVLRIGDDLIDRVAAGAGYRLGRVVPLPFLAREIETEDLLGADALGPDLAVHVVAQTGEVQLHANVVILFGQGIVFDLAGLRIEIAQPSLALLV